MSRQKNLRSCIRWALYLGGSSLLLACAGTPQKVADLPVNVNSTDNPTQQIAVLDSEFRRAHIENVPLFAPTWFKQAAESHKEVKKAREGTEDREKVFRKLAESRAQLEKAFQIADYAKKTLPDVVEARRQAYAALQKAIQAGALGFEDLTGKLADADEALADLTKKIEKDDVTGALKDKQDVIHKFAEARHLGIQKASLDLARRRIQLAESEKAEDYSPQALLVAKQKLETAEKYGKQEVVDDEQFEALSNEAAFYAQKAVDTNRDSMKYGRATPEQIAAGVDRKVGALTGERDLAAAEAADARSRLAKAEERKQKIAVIRSMFKPAEAQVFEKDGQVVIRLTGLKFENGKASLPGDSYALLDKVEDALIEFDGAAVTVEGHSQTPKASGRNYKVSEDRAKAVRKYFLAHDAVDENKVAAVGRGADEPIKPNNKEGRVANNRVDVVIVEQTTTAR